MAASFPSSNVYRDHERDAPFDPDLLDHQSYIEKNSLRATDHELAFTDKDFHYPVQQTTVESDDSKASLVYNAAEPGRSANYGYQDLGLSVSE